MALNLAGLGAVNPGYMDNNKLLAGLEMDAQNLHKGQRELDAAKSRVIANVHLFRQLSGGGGLSGLGQPQPPVPQAASAQPPMPGQASVPRAQPQQQGGAPAPVSSSAPVVQKPQYDPEAVWRAAIQQESGGRPGVTGPQTAYGRAQGIAQTLPATAKAMAVKLGLPWRPDLLGGTSDEAAQYQETLGRAYFDEGMQKYGGDPTKALAYYHGGPNEKLWGPKTRAHVNAVMARVQPSGDSSVVSGEMAAGESSQAGPDAGGMPDQPADRPGSAIDRLREYAQAIKLAEPGISDEMASEVLDLMIEKASKVSPDTRAEMRDELQRMGLVGKQNIAANNITSREGIAANNIASREGIAANNITSREGIAADNITGRASEGAANRGARMTIAQMTQDGQDRREDSRQAANIAIESLRSGAASAKEDNVIANRQIDDRIKANKNKEADIDRDIKDLTGAEGYDDSSKAQAAVNQLLARRDAVRRDSADASALRSAVRREATAAMSRTAPKPAAVAAKPAAAWKLPPNLPSAKGVANGTFADGKDGKPVAKAQGGVWVKP